MPINGVELSMNVIEVTNVSKKFKGRDREFYAVRNVSFSVKKREIFGLLGPNGAGKTTILNMLVSILKEDSGTIRIFDAPVSPDVLERMNFVSSDTKFHWVLPCKDVLEFYGRVYGVPFEEREKRIEKLSKIFEIEHIMQSKFSNLSTGERMRLSFAKAMLNKPRLLLLDEPTLGLDPDIAIKVRNEIKRVNRKFGTTILLTSHYMHEVEQLCNRIAFMHEGKIVDTGSVDRVKLKNFSSYDVIVRIEQVRAAEMLRKYGFKITGNVLKKRLNVDENVSEPLAFLSKLGINVVDVETKKPTLEDYFVKMASKKIRAER